MITKKEQQLLRELSSKMSEKVFDTAFAANNIAAGATTVTALSNIAQGVGRSQRTGDRVHLCRLQYRIQILAGDATDFVRVIIFRFKPNNASFALSSTVILDVGPSTADDPFSMYNYTNRKEVVILKDFAIPMVLAGSSGNQSFVGEINLNEIVSTFTSAATTCDNGIYLYFVSDSAAVPHPTITALFRVFYKDAG